ncbi:MAG: sulfotransferase, partial [Enterobacterales bacterium]|nr:sulfotransferase [Enterobacterales bacterium]
PQAKVILVDRHPLDACVAMYKQIFQGIYEFSYDLDDLGVYVSQMKQLMQHWQESYPDNVFVITYEDLVNNTEHTLRAACRFLNIDFEVECLRQHTSADVSTTASAAQVREKVYSSSIGKWQAYKKHLGVLEKYFPQ